MEKGIKKREKEFLAIKDKVETSDFVTIKKLRGIVEPSGKKSTWLRNLSDPQLLEIFHRFKLGHAINHVLKIIQKEWHIMEGSSESSMRRAVKKFRDETIGMLSVYERSYAKTPQAKEFIKNEGRRAEIIIKKIDGMAELAWLITVQRGRLQAMIERERVGVPNKFTDRTVEELRECINIWLEQAKALGLIDSKPREFNVNMKAQFDGFLDNVVKDDGDRLLSAAARFLELAEQKALIMKKGPDGEYELEKIDSNERQSNSN